MSDPARHPEMNEKPRCSTCRFYVPTIIVGKGHCKWAPPPALARLYSMLAAEPDTRVDYEGIFEQLPEALKRGACSAYTPRQDA